MLIYLFAGWARLAGFFASLTLGRGCFPNPWRWYLVAHKVIQYIYIYIYIYLCAYMYIYSIRHPCTSHSYMRIYGRFEVPNQKKFKFKSKKVHTCIRWKRVCTHAHMHTCVNMCRYWHICVWLSVNIYIFTYLHVLISYKIFTYLHIQVRYNVWYAIIY